MKSNQDRPTGWVCTDKQHDVVQSPERRLQGSNRSYASNRPTVGSAEQVGQVGIAGGGQKFRTRTKRVGQDTRDRATKRSESPHQSLNKRTQCTRKDKATPGARQEFHFLFEESVQVGGGLLREPIRSSQ